MNNNPLSSLGNDASSEMDVQKPWYQSALMFLVWIGLFFLILSVQTIIIYVYKFFFGIDLGQNKDGPQENGSTSTTGSDSGRPTSASQGENETDKKKQ